MGKVVAALLFMLAGACLLLAGSAFSRLFDDYKDSPDSYYVGNAAAMFLMALVLAVGGFAALRRVSRR